MGKRQKLLFTGFFRRSWCRKENSLENAQISAIRRKPYSF